MTKKKAVRIEGCSCIKTCIISIILCFILTVQVNANEVSTNNIVDSLRIPDSLKTYQLKKIQVIGSRINKTLLNAPYSISVITNEQITTRKMYRSTPEIFEDIPGIMIQKTAYGQGSPYIRGFTGFRTLFFIDGIRLNNSTFRDGPNQYWNTVDPFIINKLEVVKGAGSTIYGTDAVGGAVNAITYPSLPRSNIEGVRIVPYFYYRYATAENSHINRLQLTGDIGSRIDLQGGLSLKKFGDLRAGKGTGLQKNTGYDEYDVNMNSTYHPTNHSIVELNYQLTNQDDVWRTHKTIYGISWAGTSVGSDRKYMYDQKRMLYSLRYMETKPFSIFQSISTTLSYQQQQEQQERIKKRGNGLQQGVDVATLGLTFDLQSSLPWDGNLLWGAEYYRDFVDSYRRDYDSTGALTRIAVQGPVADDSWYEINDIYAQATIPTGNRFDVLLGARYSHVRVHAGRVQDPVNADSVFAIRKSWDQLTGNFRVTYSLDKKHTRIYAGVAQAFRAPNLSDMTRFDAARSNEIEVPSPNLKPEHYISYEVGIKTHYQKATVDISYFYTTIKDMITRTPNGEMIDEDYVVTKKNAGSGYVHGAEASTSWHPHPQVTMTAAGTWMDGSVDTYPTSDPQQVREPLDRLMPATAHFGVSWTSSNNRLWSQIELTTAQKQDKLSTRDSRDTQRIPPGGTPGYTVLSLRNSYNITNRITVSLAIENITDEDYRIHGSGQNEAGRNVVVAFQYKP